MRFFHVLFGVLCLTASRVATKRADPKTSLTVFQNHPSQLGYLDDSTHLLYHDAQERTVYVSSDEGATFKKADTIPAGVAQVLIIHPYDNRIAFVLTGEAENWLTKDRGLTWTKWGLEGDGQVSVIRDTHSLEFHVGKDNWGYVIAYAKHCRSMGWMERCYDSAYYTKDLFASSHFMLEIVSSCKFAHSSKDFKHEAHKDLVFCVAPEPGHKDEHTSASRFYSSTDFFKNDAKAEDLGMGNNGRDAHGVVAFTIVSKFAVVALRKPDGEMILYVSVDAKTFSRAHFPHSSAAQLRENAYTIVESTTHSLAVNVVLKDGGSNDNAGSVGTLFVSNSNGTWFVESLAGTNMNAFGYVDYERIYGLEGVGIANIQKTDKHGEPVLPKRLQSLITFDDGRNWTPLKAPDGTCSGKSQDDCSLHLHSVTTPHNYGRIFSSYAPGLVMGVGSVGSSLNVYEESDTYLSIDGGISWRKVGDGPNKYEFGDSGGVLVLLDDDEWTDSVQYSFDFGKSWKKASLPAHIRAKGLTTIPDSTSEKILVLGQVSRNEIEKVGGRWVTIQLDFSDMRDRQCKKESDDFEKWYARSKDRECLMGHKQFYNRRRPDADCYVGNEFQDPVEHEEKCACTDLDYECDYNFVLQDGKCTPAGPERVPPGVCKDVTKTFLGSSGYRKIPGNTCQGGIKKDEPMSKPCSSAQPGDGEIIHTTFEFPDQIVQQAYFKAGTTILVLLKDGSFYQSSSEGFTWHQPFPEEKFLLFYHHHYSDDRAYLITRTERIYWTTDGGSTWIKGAAPTKPNTFRVPILKFHPNTDFLIWSGEHDCHSSHSPNCRAAAYYSRDNGHHWNFVEDYVKNCGWAKDKEIEADPTEIVCESYTNKKGNQHAHAAIGNPGKLELIVGANFYAKNRRRKIFGEVVGFAKFSEFMVVAAISDSGRALDLQVSLDGQNFASGMFPPAMNPETHAYTILESSTHSLFLHMTMVEPPLPPWGNILKSNSNGTYFGLSIANVNRNGDGFVDFEKLIGLDGIALVNIVTNHEDSAINGNKKIQTRITHNDGASWKPLTPPARDSLGQSYECDHSGCGLQVHGYTERLDPRATFSSPSIVGLVMAVGNVGTELKPYKESDTFLSRDAGFTWEEVHKDAHLWEFGDSGSILVMVNDEDYTDHVLYSTNEGKEWREYKFAKGDEEKVRAVYLVTVPSDTSRKFILFGHHPRKSSMVAIHLNFQALTERQCVLDPEDSAHDDFELWSPSIEREEKCLFGRQMMYHRRNRDANCYVGDQTKWEAKVIEKSCACTDSDFECEYNYVKNDNGECVLHQGATPLPDEPTCSNDEDYWYERTPYRKISYSSCEGGKRPDRGKAHPCPGFKSKSSAFWWFIIGTPFAFCALIGWWYYRKAGLTRGTIRLPGETGGMYGGNFSRGGVLDTIASIPWFLVGVGSVAWEWMVSHVESLGDDLRSRHGYRDIPVDEDARILRFEDEE